MSYYSNFLNILNKSDNIILIEEPDKKCKTSSIKIQCKKRQHSSERPVYQVLSNLEKNSYKFYCNNCAKIDGEINGNKNTDKESTYHREEILCEKDFIIDGEKKWKRLLDIYNNYEVSEYGDVRNFTTKKILKPENINGYHRVTLSTGSRDSKRKIFIHLLVVICFLEYDENLYSIDHIDRNPLNNHYSNLRQCNMKENNNNKDKNSIKPKIENKEKEIVITSETWKKLTLKDKNIIEVSDYGRIRNGDFITKGQVLTKGYCSYNGYLVHKLVAEAFLPNDKENLVVNHINGNKTDNNVKNLEWISQSENTKHGFNLHSSNKLKAIAQILDEKVIAKYPSIQIASDETKILRANIEYSLSSSKKEKNILAGGFLWKYLDENIREIWIDETYSKEDLQYKKSKFSPKPLSLKDNEGKEIKIFKNMSEASKELKISVNNIKKFTNEKTIVNNKYILEFL